MAPANVISRKVPDKSPGPGEYSIATKLGDQRKSRKNIMISTSERDGLGMLRDASIPGPGAYTVATDLLRRSHNIMLSEY